MAPSSPSAAAAKQLCSMQPAAFWPSLRRERRTCYAVTTLCAVCGKTTLASTSSADRSLACKNLCVRTTVRRALISGCPLCVQRRPMSKRPSRSSQRRSRPFFWLVQLCCQARTRRCCRARQSTVRSISFDALVAAACHHSGLPPAQRPVISSPLLSQHLIDHHPAV